MAKKTCVIYDSWGTMARELPAEQAGILFQAICAYGFSGEEIEIKDPAVRAMFVMIKKKLDEDAIAYQEKAERMKKNRTDNRNQTEVTQISDRSLTEVYQKSDRNQTEVTGVSDSVSVSVSDSVYVSDNVSPSEIKTPKRTQASLVGESDLSEPVKEALMEWLAYKKERRESYGEVGLKKLITQVYNNEQKHGGSAVISVIDQSISNHYQGIIWNSLERASSRKEHGSEVMGWLTA